MNPEQVQKLDTIRALGFDDVIDSYNFERMDDNSVTDSVMGLKNWLVEKGIDLYKGGNVRIIINKYYYERLNMNAGRKKLFKSVVSKVFKDKNNERERTESCSELPGDMLDSPSDIPDFLDDIFRADTTTVPFIPSSPSWDRMMDQLNDSVTIAPVPASTTTTTSTALNSISELEAILNVMSEMKTKLNITIEKRYSEVNCLREEKERLEAKLEADGFIILEERRIKDQVQQEYQSLKQEMNDLMNEKSRLNSELMEVSLAKTTMEEVLKNVNGERDVLYEKVRTLAEDEKKLREEVLAVVEEKKQIQEMLQSTAEERQTLSEKVHTLSEESENLKNEMILLSEAKKEIEDARHKDKIKLQKSLSSINRLREKETESWKQDKKNWEEQKNCWDRQKDAFNQEKKSLKEQNESMEKTKDALEEEIRCLKEQLKIKSAKYRKCRDDKFNLQKELDQLKKNDEVEIIVLDGEDDLVCEN